MILFKSLESRHRRTFFSFSPVSLILHTIEFTQLVGSSTAVMQSFCQAVLYTRVVNALERCMEDE